MPNWKKLITSGSDAHLNSLTTPNVSLLPTGVVITGSLTVSGSNTFTNIGPFKQTGSVDILGAITSTQGFFGDLTGTSSYALNIGNLTGYNYTQSTPSTTWTIVHSLGTQTPIITVYDSNYDVVIPNTISNTDSNTTVIGFTYSTTGYATISSGDGISRNNIATSSYAVTSSYAAKSVTSSYSLQSLTSSYSVQSTSASYALTASYALSSGQATYGFVTQSIGQILIGGGSVSAPNQTILTAAIPSAGTWRIDAFVNCGVSNTLTMGVGIYKPGAVLVPGASAEITNQSGGSYFYSVLPVMTIVQTTSSANYTLRAWSNGTTDSGTSAGGKTTYMYWTKIG